MSDSATVYPPGATSTYLGPAAAFPAELTELPLMELHLLHSRICRQLDREHLTDPAGPHPITLERHRELVVELDAREVLLNSPGTAT